MQRTLHCILESYLLRYVSCKSRVHVLHWKASLPGGKTKMLRALALLPLLIVGNFALRRIPLQRIQTARRTLQDLKNSQNVIAKRWLTKLGDFPEEPLDNYLDVRKIFSLKFCYFFCFYLRIVQFNISIHVSVCVNFCSKSLRKVRDFISFIDRVN